MSNSSNIYKPIKQRSRGRPTKLETLEMQSIATITEADLLVIKAYQKAIDFQINTLEDEKATYQARQNAANFIIKRTQEIGESFSASSDVPEEEVDGKPKVTNTAPTPLISRTMAEVVDRLQ